MQSRQQHEALFDSYVPQAYGGPTCPFIAEAGGGDKFAYEKNPGWNGCLTGNLQIIGVPRGHLQIFREPDLKDLLGSAREMLSDEE